MSLIYHSAEPESKRDVYTEFDNMDYNINVGEGRVLVANSVRLLADLRVKDNTAVSNTQIYFDPVIGAHAFIDSIQVSMLDGPNAGSIENIQNYSRYVAMHEVASKAPEDAFNASSQIELKCNSEIAAIKYCQGRKTINAGGGTVRTNDQDFVIQPVCALNRMSGNHLSYEKSGTIRLTMNLAANRASLMGAAYNQAQDSYELRNPRVIYQSMADDGNKAVVVMRSVYNVKNSILSNFANVQAMVPSTAVDGVSVSFQRQSRENVSPFSNFQLEEPRGMEEVQFLFNDSTNQYISYVIKDKTEMLERYIDSFVNTGHNRICGSKFQDNRSFGVGIDFASFVDLSNQKFAMQIKSGASTTHPYNAYMYFHSVRTL